MRSFRADDQVDSVRVVFEALSMPVQFRPQDLFLHRVTESARKTGSNIV
jgi:hypothetical protein